MIILQKNVGFDLHACFKFYVKRSFKILIMWNTLRHFHIYYLHLLTIGFAYLCGSIFKYIILPFGPCSSIYVAPYNFDGARASTERTALMEWAVSAVLLSAVVESAVAERKMARPVSQPRAFLAPGHLYPIRPGID